MALAVELGILHIDGVVKVEPRFAGIGRYHYCSSYWRLQSLRNSGRVSTASEQDKAICGSIPLVLNPFGWALDSEKQGGTRDTAQNRLARKKGRSFLSLCCCDRHRW